MSARCRLSPEEELLVLEKATRVASIAAAEAAKETAKGASSATSLGEQAGRYRILFLRRRNEVRW